MSQKQNAWLHEWLSINKAGPKITTKSTLDRIERPRKEKTVKIVDSGKKKSKAEEDETEKDEILEEIIDKEPPKKFIIAYLQKRVDGVL